MSCWVHLSRYFLYFSFLKAECTQAKKDASIPSTTSSSGKVSYEQCHQYDLTGIDFYPGIETANITNVTIGCVDGWVYDRSQYESTVVMKVRMLQNCEKVYKMSKLLKSMKNTNMPIGLVLLN